MSDIKILWEKQHDIPSINEICKMILELDQRINAPNERINFVRLVGDIISSGNLIKEIYNCRTARTFPKNI